MWTSLSLSLSLLFSIAHSLFQQIIAMKMLCSRREFEPSIFSRKRIAISVAVYASKVIWTFHFSYFIVIYLSLFLSHESNTRRTRWNFGNQSLFLTILLTHQSMNNFQFLSILSGTWHEVKSVLRCFLVQNFNCNFSLEKINRKVATKRVCLHWHCFKKGEKKKQKHWPSQK